MGCCNDLSAALTPSGQNPTLHVNYTKGMVLGVDDFTQEFAYLSNRDQWAVRELLGYGTTSGLAVFIEDTGEDGPRVHVKRGAAVVPSGQLVCVPNDQCALINQWLAKPEHAAKVHERVDDRQITLYLTLCYRDCTTVPVPIPGDPCRSEDQLMVDSRIADDYYLELRTEAPPQTEEDALRDFVAWLKQHVTVTENISPVPVEEDWINALKAAVKPWFDAMAENPTKSPAELYATLRDSLTANLSVTSESFDEFLYVAFRFWVTELRPLWMASLCGATTSESTDNCVLLARLIVPVVKVSEESSSSPSVWQFDGRVVDGQAKSITVDENSRPYRVSMRLLQEWLLWNTAPAQAGAPVPQPRVLTPADRPGFTGLAIPGSSPDAIAITRIHTDSTLDASHHCVICHDGPTLTLPKCSPDNRGRIYIVKSIGKKPATLQCDPADKIDDKQSKSVGAGKALTLVSDGEQGWHIIAVA
ncbi:MAG: hypothetical protein KF908_02015 [Nitrosomonas sp.]|nr:hypothetical protein [Nitrosomonas sp.]